MDKATKCYWFLQLDCRYVRHDAEGIKPFIHAKSAFQTTKWAFLLPRKAWHMHTHTHTQYSYSHKQQYQTSIKIT